MKQTVGLLNALTVAAFSMVLSSTHASPVAPELNEQAAFELLHSRLKQDSVYKNRISLSCISFVIEETTNTYFGYALRESHKEECGGDPQTSPIVDRYQVYRSSRKIKWLEPIEGKWRVYEAKEIK